MTSLPAVFRGLLGEPINIDTLGGWISFRAGNVLPVMLGLWSVLALSGTLAGEAARGSLDLLASTPVGRRSIAAPEGRRPRHRPGRRGRAHRGHHVARQSDLRDAARRCVRPGPGVRLREPDRPARCWPAAPSPSPSRRSWGGPGPMALGLIVLFGGYVISSFGCLSTVVGALGPLSFFEWTAGHRPLAGVTDWPSVGLLAAVTVGLLAVGVRRLRAARPGRRRRRLAWLRLPSLPAGIQRTVHPPAGRPGRGRHRVGRGHRGLRARSSPGSARQFAEVILSLPQIQAYLDVLYPDIDLLQPSGLLQLAFFSFGSILIGLAGGDRRRGLGLRRDRGPAGPRAVGAPVAGRAGSCAAASGCMAAIAIARRGHRRARRPRGGERRRRTIRDVVLGTLILGLAAAGVRGRRAWRSAASSASSLAAPGHGGPRARHVHARHHRRGPGPARPHPPAVPVQAPRPADGRCVRPGRASWPRPSWPSAASPSARGACSDATWTGNVRGWTP